MRREVALSCARGASDRSMPRTHGEISFVSSKREPFTRGSVPPHPTAPVGPNDLQQAFLRSRQMISGAHVIVYS
jgi:hypothetical protein